MYVRAIIFGFIALAFLSVGSLALYYRGNAISAQAEAAQARANLAVAEDANAALEATVGRQRATEAANNKIIAENAQEIKELNDRFAEMNDALKTLVTNNADVRAFFAIPTPDALRLLDRK